MGCDEFREALSARLDGEDDPAERAVTDAHLAGCAACRQWYDAAARVTRMVRTSVVTHEVRVSDEVLAAAPGPGRARLLRAVRVALGVLGVAQFLLGAAQIGGFAAGRHLHTFGVGPDHLWHESAAWNVAVGAGFAWIAFSRGPGSGLIPTLTAFVAALSLLTASDVIAGRVDLGRVLSHAFILVGYLLVLVLSRLQPVRGGPAGGQRGRPAWRARFDDPDPAPARPALRLVRDRPAQASAGNRHAA